MFEVFNTEQLLVISPMLIYCILFLICLLEGMPVVGTIIAGGTITFAAGSVAHTGIIDPIIALIVASLGSFLGDVGGFLILRKYGSKVPYLRKLVSSVNEYKGRFSDAFDRQYFMITVVTRLIPLVRSAPSLIAASRNVPVRGYIFASILASVLWAGSGVAVGYGLSEIISEQYIIIALLGFIILSTIVGIVKLIYKKRKAKKSQNEI